MFANKMFGSWLLLPIGLLLLVLLSLSPPQHSGVHGLIHCERNGVCTGKGEPDGVTCCRGRCHSCTYMGCCHCSFTNEFTHCSIPGFRSRQYKGGK